MNFGFVPPPYSVDVWDKVTTILANAAERGGYALEEVKADLDAGLAQLWLTLDGEPINATVTRRDGETIEIWLCGGAVLSGCLPYLETILEAARADGATNGRIIGRKGWARVLRGAGWRPEGETLVKDMGE